MKIIKSLAIFVAYLAVAGGCLVTILAFFGRLWWPFELLSHFRWQYLIFLAVTTLMTARLRLWPGAIAAGGFAFVNLVVIAPLFIAPAGTVSPPEQTYRAILYNALYENPYHQPFADFVEQHQPDFILLLEVAPYFVANLTELETDYPYYHGQPTNTPDGIAIYSRYPLDTVEITQIADRGRPSLIATVELDGQPLTLVSTHPTVPIGSYGASKRNEELEALGTWAATRPGELLLLGDLNMTPWSPYFHDLLQTSGLQNGRRGFGLTPTWPTWHPFKIPIDHALVTSGITIQNFQVGNTPGSDHYPLIVDFSVSSR